jgi:hypothetical protein
MWISFMDMHSGGGQKEKWQYIYIEAPEKEAELIFYNRFGHNPNRVTCTCCGSDYSISEYKTLEEATGYNRGCAWDNKKKRYIEKQNKQDSFHKYTTLLSYKKRKDVHVIYKKDIKPKEKKGEIPVQGYVWQD